jgi:mono/diheme cytochrome c family protein
MSLFAAALLCLTACKKKEDEPKPSEMPTSEAPAKTETPEKPKVDPAVLERGKYLATIAGCALCHTPIGPKGPDMSKMFAGGLEMKESFGEWISPNITQDEKTGIGSWSDDQILAAIREGVRPDGTKLYPIMPFGFYNKLSDDDGKALVAFLRTIKGIEHEVARTEIEGFPRGIPGLPKPTGDAPPADDPVAYGGYLASLAHCGACHVPMTEKGPDMSKMFAGGARFEMIPPFGEGHTFAPNITPDEKTGIGSWSEEDIVGVIKGMMRPDKTPINFPMAAYAQAWSGMKDEDAMAIAKFLKSIDPIENKVPKGEVKPFKGPPAPGPGGDQGAAPKKG